MMADSTLVLVPSLGLLSQTLREWTFAKKEEFDVLCVCSDETVTKDDDRSLSHSSDLGFPVTTDPSQIKISSDQK